MHPAIHDVKTKFVEVLLLRPGDRVLISPYGELTVKGTEWQGCERYILVKPIRFNGVLFTRIRRGSYERVERLVRG